MKKFALGKYLPDFVYGGNDGIVTTFAVVSGFAGANATDSVVFTSFFVVLLFGLANLFADAASMGLGNFLSIRSEKQNYSAQKTRLLKDLKTDSAKYLVMTTKLIAKRGFTQKDSDSLLALFNSNNDYWVDFLLRENFEMQDPGKERAVFKGLSTFVSFVLFGLIPLLPYILFYNSGITFELSVVFTGIALLLLGIMRGLIIKTGVGKAILEVFSIGSLSALIAYVVGIFVSRLVG